MPLRRERALRARRLVPAVTGRAAAADVGRCGAVGLGAGAGVPRVCVEEPPPCRSGARPCRPHERRAPSPPPPGDATQQPIAGASFPLHLSADGLFTAAALLRCRAAALRRKCLRCGAARRRAWSALAARRGCAVGRSVYSVRQALLPRNSEAATGDAAIASCSTTPSALARRGEPSADESSSSSGGAAAALSRGSHL